MIPSSASPTAVNRTVLWQHIAQYQHEQQNSADLLLWAGK